MTPDPYEWLRTLPHITLLIARLPGTEKGRWYPETDTIVLDDRLTQVERRCTLMHELVHQLRGDDSVDDDWFGRRQERGCDEITARLMIPIEDLGEAQLWGRLPLDLAETLGVDIPTLITRVATLTPQERAYLKQRAPEWGAA